MEIVVGIRIDDAGDTIPFVEHSQPALDDVGVLTCLRSRFGEDIGRWMNFDDVHEAEHAFEARVFFAI